MPDTKREHRGIRHHAGEVDNMVVGEFTILTLGGTEVGIIRLQNGEVRAVRNFCPHKGAPVCRGTVGGTWLPSEPGELVFGRKGGVLLCPWHGFEFDLDDGRELFWEKPMKLRMYPVEVQDGNIYVWV